MEKIALAITWNSELEDGTYFPTQTQLCPWFVEWVKERKYRLQKDAMMTTIGKTVINLVGKLPFWFSQIGKTQEYRNYPRLTSNDRHLQSAR
jgi:hypothetical protein